jgi:collagen type III alpha
MALDEDGDGKVTKEELPERMQRVLLRADANEDGAIDRQEAEKLAEQIEQLRRARPGPGPGGPGGGNFVERLMGLDRNGDGKVTRDEMPEWVQQRLLERADANGDEAIDEEEAKQMAEQLQRRGGGPPLGGGPGRAGRPPERPERPPRPAEQ